jgi:hypothetical protein
MARVRTDKTAKILAAQRVAVPLVRRTSEQVLAGSRRLAPRGTHISGSGKRRRGQVLQPSLNSKMFVGVTRVRARIGSTARHAATIHQGSKAHVIRGKGKMLKFRWDRGEALMAFRGRRGSGFFYFHQVRHPGNKRPVRYLTTPLVMFGRRNGLRVTTVGASRTRLP